MKPTVGRVSRYGVIPITADQDTAGPMAKFVADAAIFLGALESASPDPNDAATKRCTPPPNRDYTPHLKLDGLKGARIGIPRAFFYAQATAPGTTDPRGGLNPDQQKVMHAAIEVLKQQGAIIVDPADIPSVVDHGCQEQLHAVEHVLGRRQRQGQGRQLLGGVQVRHEARFQRVAGVARRRGAAQDADRACATTTPRTRHAGRIKYGQSQLDISDEMDLERDRARYEADRAKDLALSAAHGIDEVMNAQNARRAAVSRRQRRRHCGKAGISHGDRPVRRRVPNAPTPPLPDGFNAKSVPVRRQLHRHGVQRAAAHRARLRVRTGHAAARAAAFGALAPHCRFAIGHLAISFVTGHWTFSICATARHLNGKCAANEMGNASMAK